MTTPSTKEPQYSLLLDVKEKHGIARLGLMVNESWNQDPKRTLFTLARYKFVARMLAGPEFHGRDQARQRRHPGRCPRPVRLRRLPGIRHPAIGDPGDSAVHRSAEAQGASHPHRHPRQ